VNSCTPDSALDLTASRVIVGEAITKVVALIAGAMAVLAALTLLALVGVFSLSGVVGALYFAWCGAVLVECGSGHVLQLAENVIPIGGRCRSP
jgi:hypothetical protein